MNPFQPGAGLMPEHMGHRPAVERPLLDIVDRLRSGQRGLRLAYLYGPRGNGKTCCSNGSPSTPGGSAGSVASPRLVFSPNT